MYHKDWLNNDRWCWRFRFPQSYRIYSNYSETTGNLWFYSEDETTNFNANIANTDSCKSFKYKANLLRNTDAVEHNCCAIKIFK